MLLLSRVTVEALSLPQTDFILIVLRDMLRVYPSLKVILMSATIDTTLFSNYFNNCPIIEVVGKTYPIQGTMLSSSFPLEHSGWWSDSRAYIVMGI